MFKTLFHSAPSVHHQKNKTHIRHDDTQLLKLEAEKIRNWHVQTEINAKNMEKVVQNLRLTVESQRKSLLEVQLEYESVGNKMQEEINKRTHCLQKIDATRDMCNLLKTQACDLEKTLSFCDNIKQDIGYQQSERESLVQQLTQDFKNLTASHEKAKTEFNNKLEDFQNKSEAEKQSLQENVASYKIEVSKCKENLLDGELVIDVLIHCLTKIQNELVEQYKSNQYLVNINKDMMNELNLVTLNCTQLQAVLDDKQINIKDNKNKLRIVRKKLVETELLCNTWQQKFNDCSSEIHNKNCKIEALEKNLVLQANSIEEIKKSKESSDQDLEACLNKLHKNTAVTKDMEQQVNQLLELKDHLFTENEKFKADEEKLKNLQNQNKTLIEKLFEELAQVEIEKQNTETALCESRAKTNELLDEIKTKNEKNELLKDQLNVTKGNLEESFTKEVDNQKNQDLLHEKLKSASEEISLLKEEINRLKKLEEIASSYDKLKVQFDNQAQSLEEARKSLELARKDLEAEKDLNGKHEDVIKKNRLTIDEQALSMKSTIDLYNEMLMIRNTLTQEVNDLDKDLQKSNKTLINKNKSHQEVVEQLKKDHKTEIEKHVAAYRSLKDKYAILKEEIELPKKSFRKSDSQLKRSRISPFYNVSESEHDISVCAMLGVSAKKQPKHSTPIQRTPKQKNYTASVKKNKSAKKAIWRRTTPAYTVKVSKNQQKNKEDNWFDTDNVYGFFD